MEDEDVKIPWRFVIILAAGCAAVVLILVHLAGAWTGNLWFNYAWASDKGNGPEAIQQTILYAAIAALFVPVVRRFLKHEFGKVHAKMDAKMDIVHDHLDHLHDALGLEKFERKQNQ